MKFDNKEEKIMFGIITIVVISILGVFTFASISSDGMELRIGKNSFKSKLASAPAKTVEDYYDFFKCPCCGKGIDSECCGMSKQRKEYIDSLNLADIKDMDVLIGYGKKFGMDDFDEITKQKIKEYLAESAGKNPPLIKIDKGTINLGTIKQADGIAFAKFTITNDGKSDLIIDNMETSCMCTSASIVYEEKEGPKFGMSMHGENPTDYSVSIKPGESATLKVEYDPNAHGPQENPAPQKIIRYITIMSNDPNNFQEKVRIELIQVP